MLQVRNELDRFLEAVRNSDVAQNFEHVRNRVDQDAYLRQQINDFRRKNFEIQTQTFPERLLETTESFRQEYAQFLEDPLVQEYLEAELAYCRMLQNVMEEIAGVIVLD